MHNFREVPKRRTDGRARLAAAASKLFGTRGYEGVSVAHLLEESGLKAPALYHHFGDKEGIYVHWALEELQSRGQTIRNTASNVRETERLPHMALALAAPPSVDLLQLRRDLGRLKRPTSARLVKQALREHVYEPFEVTLEEGGHHPNEAARLARLIVHSSLLATPLYADHGGDDTDHEHMQWIIKTIIRDSSAKS